MSMPSNDSLLMIASTMLIFLAAFYEPFSTL